MGIIDRTVGRISLPNTSDNKFRVPRWLSRYGSFMGNIFKWVLIVLTAIIGIFAPIFTAVALGATHHWAWFWVSLGVGFVWYCTAIHILIELEVIG